MLVMPQSKTSKRKLKWACEFHLPLDANGYFGPVLALIIALLLGGAQIFASPAEGEQSLPLPLLTEIRQLRELTSAEAARGYPVEITAVMTFSDPTWKSLFVQDATGGIVARPADGSVDWPAGQRVRITGVSASGTSMPFISQARVLELGAGRLPVAKPVTFEHLASNAEVCNWVEARGIVRAAAAQGERLVLEIAAEKRRVRAIIYDVASFNKDWKEFVDAEVRLRAVCGAVSKSPNSKLLMDLFVPNITNLVVAKPAQKFDTLPVRPIADVRAASPANSEGPHRVRIRGAWETAADGGTRRLRDQSGWIGIRASHSVSFASNQTVEVFGFPTEDKQTLEDATVRALALSSPAAPSAANANSPPPYLPVLATVDEVRALSAEEAQRGYPVRITGVLTFIDPQWDLLFVQSESAGIYLSLTNGHPAVAAGMRVEVEGFSSPGKFAPMVRDARVRLIGKVPLPRAKPKILPELLTGREDSQRVQIQAIVRSAQVTDGHLTLGLNVAGGQINAHIPGYDRQPAPAHLVDAEVRVPGICGTIFNQKRQLLGVRLFVNQLDEITITRPAPADPFAVEARSITNLLGFELQGSLDHRVRVQGVVTFRDPRWYTLYIQAEGNGLFVRTLTSPTVEVGDQLDAVGFVIPGNYNPILTDAIFRRLGPGSAPPPEPATIQEAMAGAHDAQLISLEGRLIDRLGESQGHGLVLQSGEWMFKAFLEGTRNPQKLKALRLGSRLRLTGICSIQGEYGQPVSALWIQMRFPEDVVVLEQPPWWTARHTRIAATAAAAGFLAITGWLVMLRRALRKQAGVIHREAERKLALEARYRELFQNANDVIYAHDLEGNVTALNKAGERLFGYSQAEALTRNIADVLSPEQMTRARELIQRVVSQGGLSSFQLEAVARDGRRLQLEISSWLVAQDGQPFAVQGIARDVTEKNKLEAQFLRSQRLENIGRLAGGIAHDLNNVLSPILMAVPVLRDEVKNEYSRSLLDSVESSAHRGANIIKQILTFSRGIEGQKTALQPRYLLKEIAKIIQETFPKDIQLRTKWTQDLWLVSGDATQLHQVLLNLCINARDAMPEGGTLALAAENIVLEGSPRTMMPGAQPGNYVLLTVSDTGEGIAPENIDKIFDPFFTTKPVGKGTGLGLSTVLGIVKSHGGCLDIQSKPGAGTVFKVCLPAVQSPALPPAEPAAPKPTAGRGEWILLIDDEEHIRSVLKRILERQGYHAIIARDGREAEALYAREQAKIKVVITDMMMPTMDGLAVIKALKQINPEVSIIVASGVYAGPKFEEAAKLGVKQFLQKPFNSASLLETVARALAPTEQAAQPKLDSV